MRKKTIRRSQLISPWGVGQMVNFPGDESLMIAGLDAWEQEFNRARDPQEFIIREERLEKRLGVSHFRFPPVYREPKQGVKNPGLKIPCVRFPQWHYCPRCGSMEKLTLYGSHQRCSGPAYSEGTTCKTLAPNKRPVLIPIRFIAVCEAGHIEDFPFMEWVHGQEKPGPYCKLRIRAGKSSSLSGIKIYCDCSKWRSLAGAFNEKSLSNIKNCCGQRPWLGEIDDKAKGCGLDLKVVQKGASNVYFPEVVSSIYLPNWDNSTDRKIVEVLEKYWDFLTSSMIDGKLNRDKFEAIAVARNVDCEKLIQAAEQRLANISGHHESVTQETEETYRRAEYEAILEGLGGDNQDFYVINKDRYEYHPVVSEYFSSISLLHKLRETRAFIGFSRWRPDPGTSLSEKISQLYSGQGIDWLPANVVRGEGIFLELDSNLINNWIRKKSVQDRINVLKQNYSRSRRVDSLVTPKLVLLHTLAHLLINQLSYSCGYGSSSLRERIYCDFENPEHPMHGILIYTASGDSEGSLGGLVRQGHPGKLENIIISALMASEWCSSDPVCMDSKGQGPDSCNLAACHSCALLPETSCELSNRLLDRALIIGTRDNKEIGFFGNYNSLL